jgi:hypothetical protein
MRRIASVLIVLLWLAPTAYLAVAAFWIIASTQFESPPYIYLAGLMAATAIWVFVTKSVLRTARRLWNRS